SAIRKVSNGIITTIAGNGTVGYSGDNGPAISATLGGPTGMALDASGNLYFADGGTRIRKISNGVITTIAGNGISGYSGDNGPATSAWLWDPSGVTVDASGNLYIADTENNVVREVSNGRITTIAGNGKRGYLGNNGLAVSAELDHPTGVAVDATGEVYIADSWNSVIRVLGPSPLSAQTASLTAAAADGSIQVTVPDGLSWTASSNDSWITITSGASGTGSGALTFSVQANNTGAVRTGTIIIDGQTFKIEQGSGAATGLILAGSMPQIASGGGWDTSLTLVNNNGQGVGELSLNFYANDGSQLLIPFTFPQQPTQGTILGATFLQYPFNAYATLVLDTTGPTSQPTVTGSCELFGGGIGAFAIFKYTPSGQEAVVPLETRNASSYLLAFDNTGQIDTGLAIANLATAAANVNVIIRDDTGAQIGTGTINLAAQGHNSFMLTDTTQGFPVTADKRGTVEFDTPQGGQISVLGLRANGAALTSLPVLANVGTTGGTMAHVASGGGWQTIFTLVNTGTASANATLNFFDDNGAALLLPLDFPQTGAAFTESSVTQAIPAGAILMIVTQGQNSGNSVTGSAQLTTNGNVSGFAIFQNTAAGQEAVVPLQTNYYGAYVLAFDNTNGLATGVAIANMAAQAADVSVVIRDDTGTQIGTGTISLAAQGHTSFMLTDASQGFPVTAGIRGTVEFDAPSADQIAVLGIRATPAGAFTTIPAM
ncbi:MAG: BACON domain-containing carbohydrate-binding protein, partial [Bryobacteraceae bacterium]